MAIVVEAVTTAVHSSITPPSLTINKPSGVADGDYLVLVFRSQNTAATAVNLPSGFTVIGPAFEASHAGRVNVIAGKAVTNAAGEPSSYTVTQTGGAGRSAAVLLRVSGVDTANPVAGVAGSYQGTSVSSGNGRRVESYSVALDGGDGLAIFMGGNEFVSGTDHTPTSTPAGYTLAAAAVSPSAATNQSRTYVWVGTLAVTGNPTNADIVWLGTAGPAAQGVTLRGLADEEPDPPTGLEVTLGDGTTGHLTIINGDNEQVTPASVGVFLPGFASVSALLATPGATWAHAGGSGAWPEMSIYAYSQAALRGYGALEVSFGRTSDGVWVGLHDNDINRTSDTSGEPAIISMTWAEVQEHMIEIGGGAPRPYCRWEEIRDRFGHTHVLILDPKNYNWGSYRDEFLAMCDELGPTRVIVKQWINDDGLADAASAKGYETWAHAYQADYDNGLIDAKQSHWSLLGMEISATTAWTGGGSYPGILSYGKPVVGHIAASQADYDLAISKGASMVQCSRPDLIAPVSAWNT